MESALAPVDPSPAAAVRPAAWQRAELLLWLAVFLGGALGNALARWLAAQREGDALPFWQPLCWEASSAALSLLLLPCLFAACRRWPLHMDRWRGLLLPYALGSLVWWCLHVSGMVALRKLTYLAVGQHYDFGGWPLPWLYEYAKDLQTFILLVTVAHASQWFRRRRQGEALLLAVPDEGPPVEPVDRPERFLVRKLGRDFLVATADIEWIQAAGNYVNLHVRSHDYPLRSTMAAIQARLDPQVFARVHRSYLVNLQRIVSIEPLDGGEARLHLADGPPLPCSRRYLAPLRERLGAAEPATAAKAS